MFTAVQPVKTVQSLQITNNLYILYIFGMLLRFVHVGKISLFLNPLTFNCPREQPLGLLAVTSGSRTTFQEHVYTGREDSKTLPLFCT